MQVIETIVMQIRNVAVPYIIIFVFFAFLDVLTGIVAAFYNKDFEPNRVLWGVAKKLMAIILIVGASVLDATVFQGRIYVTLPTFLFYVLMEFMSVISNTASMGIPVPKFLLSLMQSEIEKIENTPINPPDYRDNTEG